MPQGFTSNFFASVRMSPLRKGGDFLTASLNGCILFDHSGHPFGGAGLANLYDHIIFTSHKAGIVGLLLYLANIPQRGTIELQDFFRTNRPNHTIGQCGLMRDRDTNKAHTSLTLGVFDDCKLSHFSFLFL